MRPPLQIIGNSLQLALPPICANGGKAANESVPVEKVGKNRFRITPEYVITPVERALLCFRRAATGGACLTAFGLFLIERLLTRILGQRWQDTLMFSAVSFSSSERPISASARPFGIPGTWQWLLSLP